MSTDTKENLNHSFEKRAKSWLQLPFDDETQSQIRQWLRLDLSEIKDAFWKDLEFGTGGMRGLMGVGTSRMNKYTVQRATQGLCKWLQQKQSDEPLTAVIAYDSRFHSKEFALHAACVFAANGIEVHLFHELRPTPMLSFAVRHLKASCGIMITASHNPSQYNGFKVYDAEGCQFYLPQDLEIVKAVEATSYQAIQASESHNPLIKWIGDELDLAFVSAIRSEQRLKELDTRTGNRLSIIYTSLHGTGITLAPKALNDWGFTQVIYSEAQCKPDGNFPTVIAPNPEDASALEIGIQQLLAHGADLLIANDPDADRMGVAVRHEGRSKILSGQEIAILLTHHLLNHSDLTCFPPPAIVKSLVTTQMLEKMAQEKGVATFNILPGFKYVGRVIHQWENSGAYRFLFGAEESLGYLAGLNTRDKDGILAACLISEAALHAKSLGMTLVDRLEALYKQYGRYGHDLITISESESMEGRQRLETLMSRVRAQAPDQLGKWRVEKVEDFKKGPVQEPMVKSDLIIWHLTPEAQVILRPSGTEPKVKIYLSLCHEGDESSLRKELLELKSCVQSFLK